MNIKRLVKYWALLMMDIFHTVVFDDSYSVMIYFLKLTHISSIMRNKEIIMKNLIYVNLCASTS